MKKLRSIILLLLCASLSHAGIQQIIGMGNRGAIVSPFTEWAVYDLDGTSVVTLELIVKSNGVMDYATDGMLGGSTPGSSNWFAPTRSGVGNSHWVQFTTTGSTGTGLSGTANMDDGWHQLSSDVAATVITTGGGVTGSVTFTMEIATDSGGSNIVLTSTGNIIGWGS